jgi:hypothetical protein
MSDGEIFANDASLPPLVNYATWAGMKPIG